MPALLSFETALGTPINPCIVDTSPLIERGDADVYEEATCLANELIQNADGLMNPNGLMKTFQNQVVELVHNLPPDFVPGFPDLRTAGAFAVFLSTGYTIVTTLFPGLDQVYLLFAGFVSFLLAMLPVASNTVGKLRQSSGVSQIVLQVTKEKYGSRSICLPDGKPYDCTNPWCAGNNNICETEWTQGCPCLTCPSEQDIVRSLDPPRRPMLTVCQPSCDVCNSANPYNGTCATEYVSAAPQIRRAVR